MGESGRRIGRRPQEAVNAGRHKCPICAKGFNSRSTYVSCHLCDKPTHSRCIKETFDEEQFVCQKCQPCLDPVPNAENIMEDNHASVQVEDIIEESLTPVAIEESVAEQEEQGIESDSLSTFVQIENLRDRLIKIDLEHLIELFELENIDLDVLSEMNHEDLKSVGVTTFRWRHKILKSFALEKPQNIIENIVTANLKEAILHRKLQQSCAYFFSITAIHHNLMEKAPGNCCFFKLGIGKLG